MLGVRAERCSRDFPSSERRWRVGGILGDGGWLVWIGGSGFLEGRFFEVERWWRGGLELAGVEWIDS